MTAKKKIIPDMVARIAFVLGGVVLVIALAYGAYLWFFCRFYVPPQHMAIVTAKSGSTR